MTDMPSNERDYLQLLKDVVDDIAETRLRVMQGANAELVRLYWRIGKEVESRATWGSKFVETLSHDLRTAFPGIKGFSVRNLKYMAKFAREMSEQLCSSCCTIPWGTIMSVLDKTDPGERREWYLSQCLENGWSRSVLLCQIELGLYERPALTVNGDDYYIDPLFYNTRLRCYVVVELKNTAFKPEYVGKLNFYLTAVNELLRGEFDNPTVGLLLCSEKNNVVAEWSLRDVEKPIGVSEYQLSDVLPSVDGLKTRVLGTGGGRNEQAE